MRHPGAKEVCNGVDDDRDGIVDEDVKAGWLLLTVDSHAREVVEIDPGSGATRRVTSILGESSRSLHWPDVQSNDGSSIVHDSAGCLHGLHSCTGQLNLIGATRTGDMGGVSIAGTGMLYGTGQASDQLVRMDVATGLASPVGPLGFALSSGGVASDCATDTRRGSTTGLIRGFVMSSVPFAGVGLEFDTSTGRLLAATGSANELWSMDPATGGSTRIGCIDTRNANDLAFHPAHPFVRTLGRRPAWESRGRARPPGHPG